MGGSLMEHILFVHSRDGSDAEGKIRLDQGQLIISQVSAVIAFVGG